jgi:TolA-binding protein
LSAELDFDREAINVLAEIEESSPYFEESQSVINDILNNSADYQNSISILESLPKITQNLKSTYQKLSLRKGIQSYVDENIPEANIYLEKSLKYTNDRNHHAQTLFWQAQIKSDDGKFAESKKILDEYFQLSNGINDLPIESSTYIASYVQGYNNLKLKNYKDAELEFKNSIVGIDIHAESIKNDYVLNRILPDAFVRCGDCLFKQNKYEDALRFYNQSISRKQGNFVYSLYQRATIEGLINKPYEKLVTLEELINNYPTSEYIDDAYFHSGETNLSLSNLDKAAISYIDIMSRYGQRSPYYNTAQLRLGLINYNKGDLSKALSYYKGVMYSNPSPKERSEAMYAIEEIYIRDMAKAAEYLKWVDSLPDVSLTDITRDSLTFIAAESAYLRSDYPKAISTFTEYLSSFPNGYHKQEALYFRAESYAIQKDFTLALKDYEDIISAGNKQFISKAVPKAAAIAYNFTQDFEKAYRYFGHSEFVATTDADKYTAYLGSLRSAFKLGKDSEIIKYANLVLQNKLANTDEKASALYYQGKVNLRQYNLDQAFNLFDQVEKMVNTNQAAESRYLVAEILFNKKKYDEAEKQCNYINEVSLNYPHWVAKSLLLLSEIFMVKNDVFNARAAAEAVAENFKDNNDLLKLAEEKLIKISLIEKDQNRIKVDTSKILILEKTNENEEK